MRHLIPVLIGALVIAVIAGGALLYATHHETAAHRQVRDQATQNAEFACGLDSVGGVGEAARYTDEFRRCVDERAAVAVARWEDNHPGQ